MNIDAEEHARNGRKLRKQHGLTTSETDAVFAEDANSATQDRDPMAYYSARRNEIVINSVLWPKQGALIYAHEDQHARQVELFSGVSVDDQYWGVLEDAGLATKQKERSRSTDESFDPGYLMEYLPDLGYDVGLLASWVSDKDGAKEKLGDLEENIDALEANLRKGVKAAAQMAEELGMKSDEHQIEHSGDTLKNLMEAHECLQRQKGSDQILRWGEPRMHAEMEAFAYFVSDVLDDESPDLYGEDGEAEWAGFLRERTELYNRTLPPTDQTVADAAADRTDELFGVKRNLEKYGDMTGQEAVRFILSDVQERQFEYAASQLQEYNEIADITERLGQAQEW